MTLPWTIDDVPQILVLLLIAAVVGWLVDLVAGGRVPLGFFGTILFGLLGAWFAMEIVRPRLPFTLPSEPTFDRVPLVTATLGALVVALIWCALVTRLARRR
jgi:uncharacterized membrane protein YeaQ/YmgE (transglycosylase-associated protein family)